MLRSSTTTSGKPSHKIVDRHAIGRIEAVGRIFERDSRRNPALTLSKARSKRKNIVWIVIDQHHPARL